MALEIHFCPVLEGETAERFIYEAEHHVPHGPLSKEREEELRRIDEEGRKFREMLIAKNKMANA